MTTLDASKLANDTVQRSPITHPSACNLSLMSSPGFHVRVKYARVRLDRGIREILIKSLTRDPRRDRGEIGDIFYAT